MRGKRVSKKILAASILCLLIVAILIFFLLYPKSANTAPNHTQLKSVISSAIVTIPETTTKVYLTQGKETFNANGAEGSVSLAEPYAAVKTADGYDVFAVMTYNTGGSGEFVGIAIFEDITGNITYKGYYPVGDRVPVTKILGPKEAISGNYELKVEYKSRAEGQSMADTPSVNSTLTIPVSNHEFTTK